MKSVISKRFMIGCLVYTTISCSKIGQAWVFHAWHSHAWPMLPIEA